MKTKVEFDATNREHQVAFAMLSQFGRQHPTLRFVLAPPYGDVYSMMMSKIGAEFLRQRPGIVKKAETLTQANKVVLLAA